MFKRERKGDVLAIGSPVVNYSVRMKPTLVKEMGFNKGGRYTISHKRFDEILALMKKKRIAVTPGGGATATAAGISSLGGKAFISTIAGQDVDGKLFLNHFRNLGTEIHGLRPQGATSRILLLVSPDADRTILATPGDWAKYSEKNIPEEALGEYKYLYVDAFSLDKGLPVSKAIIKAMELAKKKGTRIGLDLADESVVTRNRKLLKKIIQKYATIVFANEREARALTGKSLEETLKEIAGANRIAVVKRGKKGSVVRSDGEHHVIPAVKTDVIDTTGAGDIYAAGFLYALSRGKNLKNAAEIASTAASIVIMQPGIQFSRENAEPIRRLLEQ